MGAYIKQLIINGDTDFEILKKMKDSMTVLTR